MEKHVGGTLEGLKVVEMAAIGPVPLVGMIMADMGARMIRVDRIPKDGAAEALGFDHRGRESIAVDLKRAAGVDVVLRLIEDADVLLEGFRPGVMEKLGLGPSVCLNRNDRLVYGRITGWGQTGPLANVAGHDLNYISLSGALHAIGPAGKPAVPLNLVGDYGGGAMLLLSGVLAAILERVRSGKGQVIDAAMTEGAATLMTPIYSMMANDGWSDAREQNLLDGGAHFYGVYECADGEFVSIGSIEPQFYALLIKYLGLNESEFRDQMDKAAWPKLRNRLAEVIRSRTRAEWTDLLEGTELCFAPVLSMAEAPFHAQNQARGSFVRFEGHMVPAPAPRFSRTPSALASPVVQVGANSIDVLRNARFSEMDIERMLEEGVVYNVAEPAS